MMITAKLTAALDMLKASNVSVPPAPPRIPATVDKSRANPIVP